MKIFKCEKCGSMVIKINNAACTPVCCGDPMTELVPGTSDGATEKHVPVVEVDGNKVIIKVGEVEHPMLENHYIQYIWLETDKGFMQISPALNLFLQMERRLLPHMSTAIFTDFGRRTFEYNAVILICID